MGQKVNPISFRLGKSIDWQSKWFARKNYAKLLLEDLKIRNFIIKKMTHCYISKIDLKKEKNTLTVTIYTARPGMLIGRSGTGINVLREQLTKLTNQETKINIEEVKEPDLDAYLIALSVAQQIEKRISYKRAMKKSISRVREAGAKGVKITCKGRLGGVEIARKESMTSGTLPLGTLRADIDFGQAEANTTYGKIGTRVWINKTKN